MESESKAVASGLLFMLRDELDHWLGAVRGGNGTWVPAGDMYEDGAEFFVELELPGVDPGDVEILSEGHDITVRALSVEPRPPKNAQILERRRGTYERMLALPPGWDAAQAKAELANGVLTLRVPRAVEPERARRISLDESRSSAARPVPRPAVNGAEKEKPPVNGLTKLPPPPAIPASVIGGPLEEVKP